MVLTAWNMAMCIIVAMRMPPPGPIEGGGAGALPWMTSIAFVSQSVTTFAYAAVPGAINSSTGTASLRMSMQAGRMTGNRADLPLALCRLKVEKGSATERNIDSSNMPLLDITEAAG
jgi:hypothetical protein